MRLQGDMGDYASDIKFNSVFRLQKKHSSAMLHSYQLLDRVDMLF
jgi:hypothetical protein